MHKILISILLLFTSVQLQARSTKPSFLDKCQQLQQAILVYHLEYEFDIKEDLLQKNFGDLMKKLDGQNPRKKVFLDTRAYKNFVLLTDGSSLFIKHSEDPNLEVILNFDPEEFINNSKRPAPAINYLIVATILILGAILPTLLRSLTSKKEQSSD